MPTLLLQLDGDVKYELKVKRDAKVIDIFYGSSEDGWMITVDDKRVPFEALREVKEADE